MKYAFIAALLWGLHYYIYYRLTRFGISYPILIIGFFFNHIIMLSYAYFFNNLKEELLSLKLEHIAFIAGYVLTAICASLLMYAALKIENPITVNLIEITFPIFTIILCILIDSQPLLLKDIIGGGIIFVGLFIILFNK